GAVGRDVGAIQGEAHQIGGGAAGGRDHRDHVGQRLSELADEIVSDHLLARVPADLAGHVERAPGGRHAVRVAARARPTFGLNRLDVLHLITCPPSMASAWPWMLRASSEQSMATAAATSSGVTQRSWGDIFSSA